MIKFYMLTWPAKQILMMTADVDTVEDAADVFDEDPETWLETLKELLPKRQELLLMKYKHLDVSCAEN